MFKKYKEYTAWSVFTGIEFLLGICRRFVSFFCRPCQIFVYSNEFKTFISFIGTVIRLLFCFISLFLMKHAVKAHPIAIMLESVIHLRYLCVFHLLL